MHTFSRIGPLWSRATIVLEKVGASGLLTIVSTASCLQSGEVVGDSDAVERRNLVGSVILYQKRILTLLGHGMIACQGASGHNSG